MSKKLIKIFFTAIAAAHRLQRRLRRYPDFEDAEGIFRADGREVQLGGPAKDEREAPVATYAAQSYTNKAIAYELGLAVSTVAGRVFPHGPGIVIIVTVVIGSCLMGKPELGVLPPAPRRSRDLPRSRR